MQTKGREPLTTAEHSVFLLFGYISLTLFPPETPGEPRSYLNNAQVKQNLKA